MSAANKGPTDTGATNWRALLKESFGASFWMFVGVAALMGGVVYVVLGQDAFESVIARDQELLADLLPRVAAAQVVAGLAWVLLPRDRMSQFMNRNRGKRGLFLATGIGIITPGGPASAYPFLAILAATGADRGILVAYITSWALIGLQRIVVWDIPFMGFDFSILRFLICLPLPLLAGMLARRLPIELALKDMTFTSSEKK